MNNTVNGQNSYVWMNNTVNGQNSYVWMNNTVNGQLLMFEWITQ